MSKIIVTQVQASPSAPTITLPTATPTANSLVQSDASGNLSFTNTPAVTSLTSSGNVSAAGIVAPYIRSTSSSANFQVPTSDGTSGQVLSTNGSGVLSFATISSSLSGTTNPTTSTVATAGTPYMNTLSGEVFICQGTRVVSGSTIYMWEGLAGTNIGIPQGQALFTSTGSSTWVCPAGVYQVSAVIVGGGGGGNGNWANGSGNGGALAYATFATNPGDSYTIYIGAGGTQSTNGSSSFIKDASGTTLFTAQGGQYSSTIRATPVSGSVTCYGGQGGIAAVSSYGGGGGAGGYGTTTDGSDAQGGDGSYGWMPQRQSWGGTFGNSGNGINGAAAGGVGYPSSTYGFGGGGGVGVWGRGESGNYGTQMDGNYWSYNNSGQGGSFGLSGVPMTSGAATIFGNGYIASYTGYSGSGGLYGGGGSNGGTSFGNTNPYCKGAQGAGRIVWGLSSRQYPNFVPDLPTIV